MVDPISSCCISQQCDGMALTQRFFAICAIPQKQGSDRKDDKVQQACVTTRRLVVLDTRTPGKLGRSLDNRRARNPVQGSEGASTCTVADHKLPKVSATIRATEGLKKERWEKIGRRNH